MEERKRKDLLSTTQYRRLLKLARFLEERDPENFNMRTEGRRDFGVTDEKPDSASGYARDLEGNLCGAAACALGWAPIVFPTILRYEVHPSTKYYDDDFVYIKYVGKDSGLWDGDLARDFFGTMEPFYGDFFMPAKNGKDWAQRLRGWLESQA